MTSDYRLVPNNISSCFRDGF